ncbi:MAG: SOS response-associated peptidase [Methylococcales bacterium]
MCGRYVSPDEAAIERHWLIDRRNSEAFQRRYNVAPTTRVPIIRRKDNGVLELLLARWGLIPSWWKQEKPPTMTFNARSEDASGKPMWRHSYRQSRCLVPALGWFEWQTREQLDEPTGELRAIKQPHFIHCELDSLFAFAGLLSVWPGSGEDPVVSCAVLTKAAAASISKIHDRMPVVLSAPDHASWLSPDQSVESIQQMVACSRQDFMSYPVSTRVNNTRNDSAELIERIPDLV